MKQHEKCCTFKEHQSQTQKYMTTPQARTNWGNVQIITLRIRRSDNLVDSTPNKKFYSYKNTFSP